MADGTPKPSVKVDNGKDPNRLDKKNLTNIGEYEPVSDDVHKQGKILMGNQLLAILADYNIDFKPGESATINNSPNALKMYNNKMGQPMAKVIKIKTY